MMNRLYVDEGLQTKLDQCTVRTELCDASGRVLGVYIPKAERERRLYERARAGLSPEIVEELKRRSQEIEGLTTDQVLQSLRDLEAQRSK
jgi:hypothetical protein